MTPGPSKPLFRNALFGLVSCCAAALSHAAQESELWLSELDVSRIEQGWGTATSDATVYSQKISIAGQVFDRGIGTHSESIIPLALNGQAVRISGLVGLDDETEGRGSVVFSIVADGIELWRSGVMTPGVQAEPFALDLSGVNSLQLVAGDAGDGTDYDHADWADLKIVMLGDAQPTLDLPPEEEPVILTPPAPATPRVNGPSVFGVRPGAPFLYNIPASGERPMSFAVDGLPEGLSIDADSGHITGAIAERGEYTVTLRAENDLGQDEKSFRIVVGDKIALTPPMGWSSWNCWGDAVSQEKVLSSARAMAEKGLSQYGWTYINIDDGWQGKRGGPLNAIQPNKKFPDMKALADEIHELGLKFGIYSGPWRGTYAGYVGGSSDNADGTYDWVESGDVNEFYKLNKDPDAPDAKPNWVNWKFGEYSFAENDAKQWAEWGVDYLKYDWFPNDPPHVREMSEALRATGRDMIYSLSNTGIYDYAPDYVELANLWRTTGDIIDRWESVERIGFLQDRWAGYTGPGHWSDPDMLVLGKVGWGPSLHDTHLSPDEQYTHISLWSLLSAPLILGCDLAQLDEFTISLLTNHEVLAINQDVLGKQATQISNDDGKVVYAKTLEDGSYAVGLFNRSENEKVVEVKWGPWGTLATPDAGETFTVRDLWRQENIGDFSRSFDATVAPHGVVLIRLIPQD
ncbi:NPCBM/NEW2 domain-containing protein [Pelagicoccus sp. SDUM812003]|uniref:NPCBM/NEW2 domain-containing protein n=1 Tax=Pelagicoccus sp. SDUM812003 TaxID=3041267 RepID=UPI002810462D|nr:NPCBM/NEW2 domain-containing protein [Pelagicoccus sp. SDUM812003]MDQ8203500.1 NPCBM/NEW2 domain-containing protein [Pelagicoccus sp. SDUM812003]